MVPSFTEIGVAEGCMQHPEEGDWNQLMGEVDLGPDELRARPGATSSVPSSLTWLREAKVGRELRLAGPMFSRTFGTSTSGTCTSVTRTLSLSPLVHAIASFNPRMMLSPTVRGFRAMHPHYPQFAHTNQVSRGREAHHSCRCRWPPTNSLKIS
jgi:hypothetical protein